MSVPPNEIRFPFDGTRPGQELLISDLEDAAEAGIHMLCAAPTGTGKTVAALFPMLRVALREGRKLFFATAKVSQQRLALETLARMLPPGCGRTALQLSARERSCPARDLRCRPFRCAYQRKFRTRLEESGLARELAEAGVWSGETIARRALEQDLCPFETSLALAEGAAAVVCDFNYVFDPHVYVRRFFEPAADDPPGGSHLLIVDEAHNLPKRAVEYYSPELDLVRMRAAVDVLRPRGGVLAEIANLFEDVDAHVAGELRRLEPERDAPPPYVEPIDAEAFRGFAARAEDAEAERAAGGIELPPPLRLPDAPRRDVLHDWLVALSDLGRSVDAAPEDFATIFERDRLRMRCLDPAPFLRARFDQMRSTLCMSATLTPLEFFARSLGVDSPDTVLLELDSPFPRENRALLAVTSVDTTFKHRSEDAERIAEILDASVRERPGSYLAFFGSFAYRDEVVRKLAHRASGRYELLLQLPGAPVEPMLARLARGDGATRLLCGVQGGVFSEGVDYPGEMAIGVFVIGPGLPQVSLEQELVRAHHDAASGQGFELAYLLPGLTRAIQAGGRAIRTPDDRAFVMLLCRRFAEPEYRRGLPRFWQAELIETDDPAPELRRFWAGHEEADR